MLWLMYSYYIFIVVIILTIAWVCEWKSVYFINLLCVFGFVCVVFMLTFNCCIWLNFRNVTYEWKVL